MASFSDLDNTASSARRGACPVCGERTAGQVLVQVAELGDVRKSAGGNAYRRVQRPRARSVSLCENHAVALFQQLIEFVEQRRKGEDGT